MTGAELYKRLVGLIREGVDAIPGHLDPLREALADPLIALSAALLQFFG